MTLSPHKMRQRNCTRPELFNGIVGVIGDRGDCREEKRQGEPFVPLANQQVTRCK
ncbi:hypothetical protein BIW11_02780 [Tropilaelaps mercedesae]|uniref:Uncharacterized protein n=1 Tax=Tropilaelaps mercedesae TaxID=418985 RepID=A0A1V9XXB6_9ACAR|nr:hypothetical protein BIW11_02780 [Tropilaelaps mercedesae]